MLSKAARTRHTGPTWLACRDALLENKKFVRVDLQDITNFDPQLGRCITDNPTEYMPVVRLACCLSI